MCDSDIDIGSVQSLIGGDNYVFHIHICRTNMNNVPPSPKVTSLIRAQPLAGNSFVMNSLALVFMQNLQLGHRHTQPSTACVVNVHVNSVQSCS